MLRLKQLAFDLSLKQREIADIIGVDQSVVSLMMNGRRNITKQHLDRLVERFGADVISKYDIGEFEPQSRQAEVTILPATVVDDIKAELSQPKPEDVETIESEEVELKVTPILTPDIVNLPNVDIKAGLEDGTLPIQTKLTQDIVPDGVVKVYLENDEMAPDIEANDPVLIRLMDKKDAIVHGRMYFVDLYRGAVVRWVFPQTDGTLLLRSKNAPDMVVQMDSVMSISEVVTIWKRPKCLPSEHFSMFEEMRRRDDQMDQLIELNKASGERESRLIDLLEKKN